ncbi:hypothetical protein FHX52_4354 [Humibacillus xanthopallidus]|uniref:Uncharacterized protein n=1 Tax=Humibacillus xanthopallidus TaxID=412689 RepID=A0A543PM13_9MICO|nr:hypothetical protein [Humibacillus xanthopallidus]TQN45121.1 hypothetical protein FHX52_4354 [Humibacillus xanthopallidus]
MYLRHTAAAIVASALLAVSSAAAASPLPDPPSHTATDTVQEAIDLLTEAYTHAPPAEKRSIHNDILLLINVGHGAL